MSTVGTALAFSILKEKPVHIASTEYLTSLASSCMSENKELKLKREEIARDECSSLNQRLIQQELETRVQLAELSEEVKRLKAASTQDDPTVVGNFSTTATNKTPKKAKSSAVIHNTKLRFSKVAQAKAERACAALKAKDEDLVKDIEFIELMKSLTDACSCQLLSEPQSRRLMETADRILTSLCSKLRRVICTPERVEVATTVGFQRTDSESSKLTFMIQGISRKCFATLSTTLPNNQELQADFAIFTLRKLTSFLNLIPLITSETEKSVLNCPRKNPKELTNPQNGSSLNQQTESEKSSHHLSPAFIDSSSTQAATSTGAAGAVGAPLRDFREEVCKIVSKAGLLVPCISLVSVFCILKCCFRFMSESDAEGENRGTAGEVEGSRCASFGRLREESVYYYLNALDEAVGITMSGIAKRLNGNLLDDKNDTELIHAIHVLASLILTQVMNARAGYFTGPFVHKVASSSSNVEELVKAEGVWRVGVKDTVSSSIAEQVIFANMSE